MGFNITFQSCLKFHIPVINKKIGKFKMGGQDVFFDVSEWIEKYYVEKKYEDNF